MGMVDNGGRKVDTDNEELEDETERKRKTVSYKLRSVHADRHSAPLLLSTLMRYRDGTRRGVFVVLSLEEWRLDDDELGFEAVREHRPRRCPPNLMVVMVASFLTHTNHVSEERGRV